MIILSKQYSSFGLVVDNWYYKTVKLLIESKKNLFSI